MVGIREGIIMKLFMALALAIILVGPTAALACHGGGGHGGGHPGRHGITL